MTEQTSPTCGAANCVYWHRSFKHLWENTALYSEVAKIFKTTISGTGKRTGWNESCTFKCRDSDEISVVSRSFLFTATGDFSRPKETGNVLLACLFLSRRLSPAATLLFLLISVRCPSLTVRHRPLPLLPLSGVSIVTVLTTVYICVCAFVCMCVRLLQSTIIIFSLGLYDMAQLYQEAQHHNCRASTTEYL